MPPRRPRPVLRLLAPPQKPSAERPCGFESRRPHFQLKSNGLVRLEVIQVDFLDDERFAFRAYAHAMLNHEAGELCPVHQHDALGLELVGETLGLGSN